MRDLNVFQSLLCINSVKILCVCGTNAISISRLTCTYHHLSYIHLLRSLNELTGTEMTSIAYAKLKSSDMLQRKSTDQAQNANYNKKKI